ncbi:Rap1a/Tai family immunity protein [Bordetella ansorpii]|nr:Rap1a/Tai family immunity protein [Bordetella ansorpii]
MISRKMWVLAFAVWMPGVGAAAPTASPSADWQLTGEQLVMAGIDGSLAPEFHDEKRPELQVMVSSSRAAAFMLGVASYTYGTRWCKADGLGQEDFAKVVETLGSLPDDRLKMPAAPLVAQALARHFPCKR